ncbi:MAG: ketoacyl-ACP synthase III [Pseudomonadota bacterium]
MDELAQKIEIRGTGRFLPGDPVASEELDARLGLSKGYLERQTGMKSRHYAGEKDQIEMGLKAARRAIEDAEIAPADIDLIVSACAIPFQTLPSTAPLLMRHLGIADGTCAAFDINSSCTSFVSATEVTANLLASGQYENALIVSSEVASRGLPWKDQPEVAALFGDGAAAAVLSLDATAQVGIRASLMQSFPSQYDACEIGAGGTRFDYHKDPKAFERHTLFRMNGAALFKITLRRFPAFVDDLLAKAGWTRDEVDVIVPHQASPHALGHMVRQTGFASSKIVNLAANIGNQIAASIPTALDFARMQGLAKPGDKMLILGTSAGVSFSGMALQL